MFKLDGSVDKSYTKYSLFEGILYRQEIDKKKKWFFEISDCSVYESRDMRHLLVPDRMLLANTFATNGWVRSKYFALTMQTYKQSEHLARFRKHLSASSDPKLPICDGLILKSQKCAFTWVKSSKRKRAVEFSDIEEKLVKK